MTLAQEIRDQTQAVAFKKHQFGVRKKLMPRTRDGVAQHFKATPAWISASKKLLDTREESYRKVTAIISRARSYWKSVTIKFPSKGIRLIRKDRLEAFESTMKGFDQELKVALDELCANFQHLKNRAREQLGDLYSPSDYPIVTDFRDDFSIEWEYPNIDPPSDLQILNPQLYEQERARVASRMEESLAQVEQALAAELQGLLEHLCDKLQPETGKARKSLSAKAVEGLTSFVDRFRTLNIRSNSDLEAIMSQVEGIANGIDPEALKKNAEQSGQLFTTMNSLKESLDSLIVEGPTRKIQLEDEPT